MKSPTNNLPLFSIIIPVYKARQYIRTCLESIERQTLGSFEVICVDDCSPDDSDLIVQEFSERDQRFKLVHHKFNSGPGAARNTGLHMARGKWVAFVDADDFYIDPDFFERSKKLIETCDCDLLVFDFQEYDDITHAFIPKECRRFPFNIAPEHFEHILDETERKKYLFEIPVFTHTKIYLREKLINYNLQYPEHIFYEDCIFNNLASILFEKIIIVNWQPYAYRLNVSGQITSNICKHIQDIVPAHEIILRELKERNLLIKYDGFVKIKFARIAIRSLLLYFLPQINNFSDSINFVENTKNFFKHLDLTPCELGRLKVSAGEDYYILEEVLKWTPGLLETSRLSILGIPILLYYRDLEKEKLCLFHKKLTVFKKIKMSVLRSKIYFLGIPVCIRRGNVLFLFGHLRIGKLFFINYYTENHNFYLEKINYLNTKDLSVFWGSR